MKAVLRLLMISILAAAFSGCGSENAADSEAVQEAMQKPLPKPAALFTFTEDGYGLQRPSFLYTSASSAMIRISAQLATSAYDGWHSRDIVTIFIDPAAKLQKGKYVLTDTPKKKRFPGSFVFSNGRRSTWLTVVDGTVNVTSGGVRQGEQFAADFRIFIEDRNPVFAHPRVYAVGGRLSTQLGASVAVTPATSPVPPAAGGLFAEKCAGCHSLDTLDDNGLVVTGQADASRPNVSLMGGIAEEMFAGDRSHAGISLSAEESAGIKTFLNAS